MKKALFAALLVASVAGGAFAYDFTWTSPVPSSRSLVVKRMSIDAYLPWSSGGSAKAMGMAGAFTAVADDLGGAVEYNPAGLTNIGHLNVSALAVARRATTVNSSGKKSSEWNFVPTQAGAALKIGPVAVALSRKQPENSSVYKKFSGVKYNIYAPDGWTMAYDTYSDELDTSELKTMVLTGAIKLGKLSVGANYNSIKGDITRTQRGRISTQEATWYTGQNNRFDTAEVVKFDGYTLDAGLLYDMGALRLGLSGKNIKGSVDVQRGITWQDNFAMGAGNTWNWTSPSSKETITKFAPTYTAGAALMLGKLVTVDLDYSKVQLQDDDKTQARLGAEVAVIPGFLFARGGVKADLKNKIDDEDNKAKEYFLGAGLKMLMLTVDASASLKSVEAGSAGDAMSGGVSATLKF